MIGVDVAEGLWTLTIARPEKANSLTRQMLLDLESAVGRAAAQGARAVVLTGSGKVFSAGADLDEARAGLSVDPVWDRLSNAIAALPCLTIAALNGTLAGGAMGMALACDLRLAVAGASFFYPVMRLGYLPQPADPPRLASLVGPARAKMILMAGARIGSEQALSWGLIDSIHAPEDLLPAAHALAADSLGATAAHVAAIKKMIAAP